jgi:hypothetical protein
MDPTIQTALSDAKDALVEVATSLETSFAARIEPIITSLRSVPGADWQSAEAQAGLADLEAVLAQRWPEMTKTVRVILGTQLMGLQSAQDGGSWVYDQQSHVSYVKPAAITASVETDRSE